MAKRIRQLGRILVPALLLLALIIVIVPATRQAQGDPLLTSPYWVNQSPSPECSPCSSCGCEGPPEWMNYTSVRTGELNYAVNVFTHA